MNNLKLYLSAVALVAFFAFTHAVVVTVPDEAQLKRVKDKLMHDYMQDYHNLQPALIKDFFERDDIKALAGTTQEAVPVGEAVKRAFEESYVKVMGNTNGIEIEFPTVISKFVNRLGYDELVDSGIVYVPSLYDNLHFTPMWVDFRGTNGGKVVNFDDVIARANGKKYGSSAMDRLEASKKP